MTDSSGQTVIAFAALVLSVIALVGQFYHGRKAHLSVCFAKTPDDKGRADRLVIVNHGAASAKKIKLTLESRRDPDWRPYQDDENPFPIQELASGAAFYMPVNVHGQDVPFVVAKLTWRDRRWRTQHWTSTVSTTGQILGGASLENFHAAKEAKKMDILNAYM